MVKFEDIKFNQTNIWKKEFSNEELMDLICQVFPGSWLPYGKEGLLEPASKYFKVISIDSGRLDYCETIRRWSKLFIKFSLKKYLYYASLAPSYLFSKSFREFYQRWKTECNLVLFEREVFEHYRIVFEKVND
jgi:cyclopropane-fatty-acyl-phospholipid synthase